MDKLLAHVKIGLGVGGIGEGKEAGKLGDPDYIQAIRQAYDVGYRLFDTAEAYGDGRSETLIGAALPSNLEGVIIATKVSPENLMAMPLQEAAKASLKRLGREQIDLLQIHWPNPDVPAEEIATGLSRLHEQGLVRSVGVCNYSPRQAQELKGLIPNVPFISSQVELSLVDQFPMGRIHKWAEDNEVSTLAYSPLGKGRIASQGPLDEQLGNVASEFGATKAQISLAWIASLGKVIPIPASRNPLHLIENFNFSTLLIPASVLQQVSELVIAEDVKFIMPAQIRVALDGEGSRLAYTTLSQALKNELEFCPSPESLSRDIALDRDIKPVRIQKRGTQFFLIEGRVRFWAWVIAFGLDDPIPCTVVSDVVV
jgi:diketogulonate reductase-like aldo/keto reductase